MRQSSSPFCYGLQKKVAAEKPFNGNVENSPPAVDAFADSAINDIPGNFGAEVRILIDYGNKTEAVRIVCEKLELDLKDAKELVDKMEQGAPIPVADSIASTPPLGEGDSEVHRLATTAD